MKKLLLTTAALVLLGSTSAYAQLDLNVSIGRPAPVYVAPAPVMVAPQPVVVVNEPHHRNIYNDQLYWQEARERERWEHEHPGGHWDHAGWVREHHR